MNQLGLAPAPEGFHVELDCDPRRAATTARPARSARGEEGIRVRVSFSEREYGRADYSVPRHARE